jgi:hypothetical protein
MMEDTARAGVPDLSADALREWQALTDRVLRRIAHSLNNQAAAISAVLELSGDPAAEASAASILETELERVRGLVAVLGAIGTPSARSEAFAPADAARDAALVLGFYDDREQAVFFDADGAPPTRLPRWLFVRALIAIGAVASRRASTAAPATVQVRQDGEWIVVQLANGDGAAVLSPYGAELASAMGGDRLAGGLGFRVPTLAAIRQREAR